MLSLSPYPVVFYHKESGISTVKLHKAAASEDTAAVILISVFFRGDYCARFGVYLIFILKSAADEFNIVMSYRAVGIKLGL